MSFMYEFGDEADLRYQYAANYLDYLGTKKLTKEQIKQKFYKLACQYNINVNARKLERSCREHAFGSCAT